MKKIKILLLLSICLILVSCVNDNSKEEIDSSNNISIPDNDLDIEGIWKFTKDYNISELSDEKLNINEIFISRKVSKFETAFILNPSISSRYVNLTSYLTNKVAKLPEDFNEKLEISEDMVKVYKISDNLSSSFEFVDIGKGRLLTIYLRKIIIFEKNSELTENEIENKYKELSELRQNSTDVANNEFGLAISFRVRDNSVNEYIKYDYYTYFFKKTKDDVFPKILKVRDIVIPKTTGLWTINQSIVEDETNMITNYRLSANQTFIEDDLKVNNIQDNFLRVIDYVNQGFIAVTNYVDTGKSLAESYSIYNIHELASNKPLNANEIAGNDGNRIYQTAFKEVSNQIISNELINITALSPNTRNIGIEREKMSWKFISNLDVEINSATGARFTKQFDLNFSPIINIAQIPANNITWRDIISRKPGAIDATVAPNSTYVLVQNVNSIEIFPIIYNFIGNKALFAIQNVDDYEMVSVNWIQNENIDGYYEEYNKLDKLNNYIIIPN
nr:hypothetical protein [Helcococcus sueciensis]